MRWNPPRRLDAVRRLEAGRLWWNQSIGGHGLRRMRELDLNTHALALCAQQVLCTAPLIVAISAVMQRTSGRTISFAIARFFGMGHEPAQDIARLFGRTSNSISTLTLALGLATAVVFMTSVGAVQQRGFELIWTLPRTGGVRSYLRQLLFAPALAAFTIAVLLAGRIGRWLDEEIVGIGPWAVVLLQGAMTFLFYWWTQQWLLDGRVTWRALLPGALAVGILTTILVRLSRVIVPGQISWQVHAYGLIGAVFVLSVWLMVLSGVIFGGVLFGAVFTERRTDPSSGAISPLTGAGADSAAADQDQDPALPKI